MNKTGIIQNPVKIDIFKVMEFHNALVATLKIGPLPDFDLLFQMV